MPNTVNGISHADLTQQQVDDIQRRIRMEEVNEKPDFSEAFEDEAWPEARESVNYRTLIHQPIDPAEVENFTLKEFTAPVTRGLKYGNFSFHTKSYGVDFPYSWQDVEGNPDSIVTDIRTELGGWTSEMRTSIYGNALLKSKSSLKKIGASDATGSLLKAFRKAYAIFAKLGIRSFANGEYLAYAPVEIADKLTEEYMAAYGGKDIPTTESMKAIEGYVGSFKSFAVKHPTQYGEKVLVKTTADGTVQGYYVIFIGRTTVGRLPAKYFHKAGGNGIELILNPLGSGVVEDSNGKIKADNNKQKGSVAENMKYVSAHIMDDRAVLTLYVEAGYSDLNLADDTFSAGLDDAINNIEVGKGAYDETYKEGDKGFSASPVIKVKVGGKATQTLKKSATGATSAAEAIATVAVSGNVLTVTGVKAGETDVTITFADKTTAAIHVVVA